MTTRKPVTLDSLAGMIKRGFDDIEKRLGSRIDGLENRLDSRIDALDSRIDALDAKLDLKFNGLQNRMDAMSLSYVTTIQHHKLETRVEKLERNARR